MKKIYLTKAELSIVKDILGNLENIYVFGSRVTGTHKKFSDLDLCLKDSISSYEYELLKEKFQNSDLIFLVDLVEYDKVQDYFKKIIDKEGVLLD